jgi:hypothetical protein
MHFPAEGGEGVITFEKNINDEVVPVLKSSSDNVVVKEVDGEKAVIAVEQNETTEERKSTVEVDYYGKKYEVEVIQEAAKVKKPFYMALKSNMLYDLGIIPNGGVEFYLGKNFSAAANWMYAWWKSDQHNWYWRTYGGDLSIRKWFGKAAEEKPLTGHHIGIFGQVLTYDFQLGNMGIIGGRPGGNLYDEPNFSAGLEYGYSLPISSRLNIDFSIGFGYHWGIFYEYLPIDGCYVWQATKKRSYIGPTKAGISLVWLLGRGNANNIKKGGRR